MAKTFRWLHLSDLHAGMAGHGWLWPTFKSQFLDDLKRVHQKTGAWDLVIFSGDLAQKGEKAEYDKVTEALLEIWQLQNELGFNPSLVAVPGNHDLIRPKSDDPTAIVMKGWWEHGEARKATLTQPDGPYRQMLSKAFSRYCEWKASAAVSGIPFSDETPGLFPGDFSTTISTPSGRLGVVGLNTSWLQLDVGDYLGRLSLEVQQLLDVTGADPEAWCRQHDQNIIVTHHPENWLDPRAVELWRSDINPTGRFSAHLFGHMHDPDVTATTSGGSRPRRSIQAASLFGLEKIGETLVRTNGYSVAALGLDGGLQIWPRISQKQRSGTWKLVPDESQDLDDSGSFHLEGANPALPLPLPLMIAPAQASVPTAIGAPSDQRSATRVLNSLRYYIPGHFAHNSVRRVEQRRAMAALADDRAVWLSADWGAGSDGFIKSILDPQVKQPPAIYKLDLADYVSREDFLDEFKGRVGISFEQLCADLATEGFVYLVLDNSPTSTGTSPSGRLTPEGDVEQIVEAILNFCPDLQVILRSRRAPIHAEYVHVALRPLDEADVRSYVLDHEKGGAQYGDTDAISAIHRHADGVPARIDTTLRELEIVPIEELSSTNSDLVRIASFAIEVPSSLRAAIDDLAMSSDPDRQRSYALLKALANFPNGESIIRLRRFYGTQPIFPGHARELLDSSLVSSAAPIGAQVGGQGEVDKLLVVPRPVRDYVRSILPSHEQLQLTRAAAAVYFGDGWATSGLKNSVADKFARASVPSHEVTNANSIILRLLNEALDASESRGVDAALNIGKGYITALFRGDHFRHVVSLSRDLLARLPEEKNEARAFFTYQLGRSLRMMGKHSESIAMLDSVESAHFPAPMKQMLQLSQALAKQSLEDSAGAIEIAKELSKKNRTSSIALQARAIILEESDDTTDEELRALERTCRKNSADVVANNLALSRSGRNATSHKEAGEALDDVLNSKSSDFYNRTRAIVKKVRMLIVAGEAISDSDKSLLIDSYHFLYNERLPHQFDACHKVLWDLFVEQEDQVNLLKLFLHSSLIWRLRGEEQREESYLKKLAHHVHSLVTRDFRLVNREMAYYLVRASASEKDGVDDT